MPQFELNQLRKDLIKPDLIPRYTHLCKPSVKTTQWLFGDELSKVMKEMDEEQKAAGVMRNRRLHSQPGPQRGYPSGFGPFAKPYARPSQAQKYKNAGWMTSSKSRQPFLGGRQGQYSAPPPRHIRVNGP